ncbi:Os09g0124433 [Oryza sativa Japonica Group]|uniref:Os09g0124433 protein n=1 Tax=Oryza sativa subsp. japonica TaxID=39947 RepID=A0A0P0XJT5_ORYSJ|nr:Os09g0124433 [Oryza sativa Japonica Group]
MDQDHSNRGACARSMPTNSSLVRLCQMNPALQKAATIKRSQKLEVDDPSPSPCCAISPSSLPCQHASPEPPSLRPSHFPHLLPHRLDTPGPPSLRPSPFPHLLSHAASHI